MEVHLNRAPLYRPEKSFLSRKNGRIFCIYSPSDFFCAMFIQICRSPGRKRFRLVSAEQRQTEERDFRSWPRKKWNESEKMKEGEGKKENRRQTPSPLFYSPHFLRGLWLSFLVLRCETARKLLLRRLIMPENRLRMVSSQIKTEGLCSCLAAWQRQPFVVLKVN